MNYVREHGKGVGWGAHVREGGYLKALTLFSEGFCSSILRKTHFAITWLIFFKIQILTLPGPKTLQLKP